MKRFSMLVTAVLLLSCAMACNPSEVPADLIVVNAKITTQDPEKPSASALAIRDGLVVATGDAAAIERFRGDATQVVDVEGRRVIPGLVDSHLHAVRGGRFYAAELRWDGVRSLKRGLEMIREQAARTPPGEWVRVIGGWSPFQFEERRMPTVAELNQAAPDTPVFVLYLYSRGFLNQAGLDALGITADTQAPPGTRYGLGADGEPTGVLLAEPNPTILYKTVGSLPPLTEEQQAISTRWWYRELNSLGLTSAVDAGGGGHLFPRDYVGTEKLADAGQMPIRISYYLFPQHPGHEAEDFDVWIRDYEQGANAADNLEHGYELEGGGEFLVWAAGDFENFLAPRPDLGERDYEAPLREVTEKLVRNSWPFRIHATYDESIVRILDVFESVDEAEREAGRPGFAGIRWAVDHAETLSQASLDRIKRLGGAVAIQARMAYAGEYFAERYGADAAAQAPPIRRILESGVPFGVGTDGTRVASHNPWPALYWLITGRTVGDTQLAAPENRLSREEALRLYTVGSAWFSNEETVKGRLSPGQFADLAVLTEDYFSVDESRIPEIRSVLTIVGGRVVHGNGPFADLAPELPPLDPEWSPVRHFGELAGL
jgi:predicted amidohydrolase YtcJ